jgi:glutamate-1-semialdehyde 2,1-aminomutase
VCSSDLVVVPYNDAAKFEDAVKENKTDLAAVIVEPIVGNIGLILPKEGFLKVLREVTEANGIVLIFDEIITGFRVSLGGAQELFQITPDLTTLGKILGGGFPVAAFVGKEEIMKMIAPQGKVYQAGTYSGNPISVTAALTTLKLLQNSGQEFYKRMEENCKSIIKPLKKTIDECKLKIQATHIASMFQFFFTQTPVTDYKSAKTADNVKFMNYHAKLLEDGVFVPPSQFETCFLSKAHSQEDLEKTVRVFSNVLRQSQ